MMRENVIQTRRNEPKIKQGHKKKGRKMKQFKKVAVAGGGLAGDKATRRRFLPARDGAGACALAP